MSEAWKASSEGWRDAPENKSDPAWWYETRLVDENGEPYTGWMLFGGRVQYRKLPADRIAQLTREKEEKWSREEMAFQILPVYSEANTRCAKCGGTSAKVRCGNYKHTEGPYNDHGFMVRTCRTCRYEWHEKPLDWENPV